MEVLVVSSIQIRMEVCTMQDILSYLQRILSFQLTNRTKEFNTWTL